FLSPASFAPPSLPLADLSPLFSFAEPSPPLAPFSPGLAPVFGASLPFCSPPPGLAPDLGSLSPDFGVLFSPPGLASPWAPLLSLPPSRASPRGLSLAFCSPAFLASPLAPSPLPSLLL